MRLALPFLILASPATAWNFTPSPICTLSHETSSATIEVTFDAVVPEYTLTITLKDGSWPDAGTFGMQFSGDRPISIGTNWHQIDGPTLTVKDRGFGNVLDGLQFNDTATATSGSTVVSMGLADAADAVADFRLCPAPAIS